MGRKNKLLLTPFNSATKRIKEFIDLDEKIGVIPGDELSELIEVYKNNTNLLKEELNYIEGVEEIITQMRCQKLIESEIKIFVSQIYVYARTTFYRRDYQIKDIRVPVGTVEELGDDMSILTSDPLFMENARDKLWMYMNVIIDNNVKTLIKLNV